MTHDSVALRERIGVLERRVAELSRAAVRISMSLDLDTVVHAVVQTLRRKLGENGRQAAYILNERRVGYRMPAPRE